MQYIISAIAFIACAAVLYVSLAPLMNMEDPGDSTDEQ
jgi:hypothetical protein